MKLLFIILCSLSSFFAKSTPVKEVVVSAEALYSFNHSFASAKEVYWSEGSEFYKAEFVMSGQYLSAYFSKEDGYLLAITKNIRFTDLPVILQTNLKDNYCNYWITDIVEVSTDAGVNYYLTMENADRKLILQSAKNTWTIHNKQAK